MGTPSRCTTHTYISNSAAWLAHTCNHPCHRNHRYQQHHHHLLRRILSPDSCPSKPSLVLFNFTQFSAHTQPVEHVCPTPLHKHAPLPTHSPTHPNDVPDWHPPASVPECAAPPRPCRPTTPCHPSTLGTEPPGRDPARTASRPRCGTCTQGARPRRTASARLHTSSVRSHTAPCNACKLWTLLEVWWG